MRAGISLTFEEEDLGHELHSGQTDGVQEADGPEATSLRGQQPPKALLASSYLQGKDRSLEEYESAKREDTKILG